MIHVDFMDLPDGTKKLHGFGSGFGKTDIEVSQIIFKQSIFKGIPWEELTSGKIFEFDEEKGTLRTKRGSR